MAWLKKRESRKELLDFIQYLTEQNKSLEKDRDKFLRYHLDKCHELTKKEHDFKKAIEEERDRYARLLERHISMMERMIDDENNQKG